LGLDNVTFRPPVPKDQIFNALAQFDVGILSFLPGEQFTFGISPQKMFDYMAACLPIVSNVHGEVATLIEDAGAGVTAPEQTAEGLARTLDAVVRAGEETWAPREFGRTYLEHHANRRAMVATLVDRIERI
jgi:glycosyltransferase involved in cell wall biosynthesis